MKKVFWGLILGIFLFSVGVIINSKEISVKQLESPKTRKVMVLNFNPVSNVNHWNNPKTLTNQYIVDIKAVSGNYADYQIVDWQDIDDFPVKQNGFDFTDSSFLQCLQNNNCDAGMANYNQILSDYQICEKRNSGEIDELWLWGGPWFGYWEAVMAGPNAFNTNGPPVTGTTCQKQLHIMGFNYERGVPEMLEDLGHRAEGTMRYVYGSWEAIPTHAWNRFTLYDKIAPQKAACGNIHYAPNSQSDYDWSNQTVVSSNCEDWLNYPNLTGARQDFNCSRWNCNGYDYKKWWLNHLPKASGQTEGKWNNWWRYILDYEEAVKLSPAASSSPSPSPLLLRSPSPTPLSLPPKQPDTGIPTWLTLGIIGLTGGLLIIKFFSRRLL